MRRPQTGLNLEAMARRRLLVVDLRPPASWPRLLDPSRSTLRSPVVPGDRCARQPAADAEPGCQPLQDAAALAWRRALPPVPAVVVPHPGHLP